MDLINPLYESSLYKHYIRPAWEVVSEEFEEIAPIEQGRWHFRSIIVLVGIGCSISALVLSLFESSSLLTIFSLAATAILCFALYYVSRYEEQKKMIELLSEFEEEVESLSQENDRLKTTSRELEETRDSLQSEVDRLKATESELRISLSLSSENLTAIQATNRQLDETLAATRLALGEARTEHEAYRKAHEAAQEVIQANLNIIRGLEADVRLKQEQLTNIVARVSAHEERLARLPDEITRLEKVRAGIEEEVANLRREVNRLKTKIDLNEVSQA